MSIFGEGMGPAIPAELELDREGRVATRLSGVQVFFDGQPAPLIFVQERQLSGVVPYNVAGKTSVAVQRSYAGSLSTPVTVPVQDASPGIFTMDSTGRGPGAIINENGVVNSSGNPAPRGSVVAVYATGEGETDPAGIDGQPAAWPAPLPRNRVTATVDGVAAEVLYSGGAPGAVAGFLQVNVRVPREIAPNPAAPIVLTIGGVRTQAGVTAAVQ